MSRPEEEDFLGRWSARKLKAGAQAPEPAQAEAPSPAPAPEGAAEKTDAEILEELGLPDPERLMKDDDFKAFLRAGIPARLRARALRRLWVSDPVLANLDGLNDYEQDFTDKATVRPDLKTAYRVGKGFLRQEPQAAAAEASDPPVSATEMPAEDVGAERSSAGERASVESGATPPAGAAVGPETRPPSDGAEPVAETAGVASRPPRMRFRFDAG